MPAPLLDPFVKRRPATLSDDGAVMAAWVTVIDVVLNMAPKPRISPPRLFHAPKLVILLVAELGGATVVKLLLVELRLLEAERVPLTIAVVGAEMVI